MQIHLPLMIVRTLAGSPRPHIFLSCSQITQEGKRRKGDALIALPSDIADTHRSYNGLPISVESVWWEKFHKSTLRRSSHEHRIREVVAIHAQHDLSSKTKQTTRLVYKCGEKTRQRRGTGQVQKELRLTVD